MLLTLLEQSPEPGVDEELIDWLKEQLNQYAFLQLSHPHLVKVPTKDDEKKFLRLMQFLTQQKPVQVDYSTLYNYWRRISETKHPEKGIPLLRELLTHISTSGNNMSDKRTVTREEIQELIYICGDIAGEEMPFKEVVDWLRERGIEVVEK